MLTGPPEVPMKKRKTVYEEYFECGTARGGIEGG
jgi:hypothetical protein